MPAEHAVTFPFSCVLSLANAVNCLLVVTHTLCSQYCLTIHPMHHVCNKLQTIANNWYQYNRTNIQQLSGLLVFN